MNLEEKLIAPEEFPFPLTPYPIQKDFMKHLYTTLEEGKLGIFESPTGTGKSLSLICGALCWLRDHEQRERHLLEKAIEESKTATTESSGNEFDWLNQQAKQVEQNQQRNQLQQQLNSILKRDEKIAQLKKKVQQKLEKHFTKRTEAAELTKTEQPTNSCDDDDDILLEEYNAENEDDNDSDQEEDPEQYTGVKVYFCSRTHSQLAQFVGEVQRSPYGKEIRLVSLASRQSCCINETVQKLKSLSLINERCIDMQRKKKGRTTAADKSGKAVKRSCTSSGCSYLQQKAIERLRDEVLLEVQDVEELVKRGKQLAACPYYASRGAVTDSQVVVIPYNTLLHKATRKACGIKLSGNVVIIDEAHNLLDTIGHIHSAEVSGNQLAFAYSQLTQYQEKYKNRFSALSFLRLGQIIFIVGKLIKMLGGKPGCNPAESSQKGVDTKIYSLSDFVMSAEIDNMNLYILLDFCQKTKLAHKLHGYAERYQPSVTVNKNKQQQQTGIRAFLKELSTPPQVAAVTAQPEQPTNFTTGSNPILPLLGFIEALTNHCEDGRVVCSRQATVGKGSLKFLLLNPAAHFVDIVKEARAVVVAGGTMQPVEEFREQLFLSAGGDLQRITEFSCGHVIPPDNILPISLAAGPSGKELDFSFQARTSIAMMNEIGRILQNLCNVVPAGVVCFFPSYDYEKLIFQHFEKSGIISKVEAKKKVFREPKKAGMVDQVLAAYADCIRKENSGGAIMFSVVGGKLSEGLNFSDDLGRCVVLVGMPYPNITSPELQEKMSYLNTTVNATAGQRHYENLCMKAVNQSIGRAVRHRNDYATVLLLDHRYTRPKTQAALPSWIQASLVTHSKFGPAFAQLAKEILQTFIKKSFMEG